MPDAESQLSQPNDEPNMPAVVGVLHSALSSLALGPDYPATTISAEIGRVAIAAARVDQESALLLSGLHAGERADWDFEDLRRRGSAWLRDKSLDRVEELFEGDAMGHGVQAAQLPTLAVGSLRNSRRRDAGVLDMAQTASRAVAEHAAEDQFVTGQVLRIDLASGAVKLVNAGYSSPLLVRGGAVMQLDLDADPVFGVLPDLPYQLQQVQLEPGDRLVLLTDGMYERNAEAAQVEQLLSNNLGDLHPREAVQALTAAVVRVTAGNVLDDATALVLDWYGGPARGRGTNAGASAELASD